MACNVTSQRPSLLQFLIRFQPIYTKLDSMVTPTLQNLIIIRKV